MEKAACRACHPCHRYVTACSPGGIVDVGKKFVANLAENALAGADPADETGEPEGHEQIEIALQTPVITLTTDQRQACAWSTTYTLAVLEWFSRIHWKDVPNQQTSWVEMSISFVLYTCIQIPQPHPHCPGSFVSPTFCPQLLGNAETLGSCAKRFSHSIRTIETLLGAHLMPWDSMAKLSAAPMCGRAFWVTGFTKGAQLPCFRQTRELINKLGNKIAVQDNLNVAVPWPKLGVPLIPLQPEDAIYHAVAQLKNFQKRKSSRALPARKKRNEVAEQT